MLLNWFKKKLAPEEKVITILHPRYKKLIRQTCEIDGIKFYEFVNPADAPARRYSTLNDFIEDKNRGFDRQELDFIIEEIIKSIESNSVKGVTNALIIAKWMRARLQIHNDIDLVLRLISCALFTDDEDVRKYDWDLGTKKIELFEKHGMDGFFLTESFSRYWTTTHLSQNDINLLFEQRKLKKRLLSELTAMGTFQQST